MALTVLDLQTALGWEWEERWAADASAVLVALAVTLLPFLSFFSYSSSAAFWVTTQGAGTAVIAFGLRLPILPPKANTPDQCWPGVFSIDA